MQAALTDRVEREAVSIATNAGANQILAGSLSRPIVTKLVADLPQSAIGRSVLSDSHRLLVGLIRNRDAVQTQNGVIVLDLRVVVQQVLQLVGAAGLIDPKLVPASEGQILLVKESDLTLEFKAARAFDRYARYIIALPLVLIALAVVVATNRTLCIGSAGIVLASCAAIRIGLLLGPMASSIRNAALIDPSARAAASATYDTVAMSFVRQDLIVAGIGGALLVLGVVLGSLKRAP